MSRTKTIASVQTLVEPGETIEEVARARGGPAVLSLLLTSLWAFFVFVFNFPVSRLDNVALTIVVIVALSGAMVAVATRVKNCVIANSADHVYMCRAGDWRPGRAHFVTVSCPRPLAPKRSKVLFLETVELNGKRYWLGPAGRHRLDDIVGADLSTEQLAA